MYHSPEILISSMQYSEKRLNSKGRHYIVIYFNITNEQVGFFFEHALFYICLIYTILLSRKNFKQIFFQEICNDNFGDPIFSCKNCQNNIANIFKYIGNIVAIYLNIFKYIQLQIYSNIFNILFKYSILI